MTLEDLGWDEARAREFEPWAGKPAHQPGRVLIGFNYLYRVGIEGGEIDAVLAGRLKHHAERQGELPAVGDWVAVRKRPEDHGAIVAVLPRRSRFSRRMAGNVTDEQVVAANVDVIFIVMSLDDDFSVRRLERYLLMARESGATPVVLLTKPDLSADLPADVAEVVAAAGDVPVHVLSPKLNQGLEQVAPYMTGGRTAALLGSSGVGKSTIINRLVGADVQKTREVREADSKGRHTTTHRELVVAAERRTDDRHARHARAAALGCERERARHVRGRRSVGGRVSLHRLPSSRRAAMRGEDGRGRGAHPARSSGQLSASCRTSSPIWRVSRTSGRRLRRSAEERLAPRR